MRKFNLFILIILVALPFLGSAQDTITFSSESLEEESLYPNDTTAHTESVIIDYTLSNESFFFDSIQPAPADTLHQRIQSCLGQIDSLQQLQQVLERRLRFTTHHRDSLLITNERFQKELQQKNKLLEDQVKAMQEKELLFAEKEEIYRKAIASNDLDKAKFEGEIQSKNISIEAKSREIAYLQRDLDTKAQTLTAQKEDYDRLTKERDRYRHIVDSLNALVRAAELENVRKDEANKYLAQRAKEAEEKVQAATNKKKKVRPIQGVAMRFYRTPDWELYLNPKVVDGTTSYEKSVRNRNAGKVEFDFVTGASVMLWDMTNIFNGQSQTDTSSVLLKSGIKDLPKFDQQFAYDLGFYVGFGGSNLFKNFYVGPSFRFMDFFYLTLGVNIAEFEELDAQYNVNTPIDPSLNLANITSKVWKVTPYISFNIDLDFLSYIKK